MRAAYDLLRPNGLLVVAVPNINSIGFQWFQKGCCALELSRHLTFFSPTTLSKLVRKEGFEVLTLKTLGHSSWIRRSVALAKKRAHSLGLLAALRNKLLASFAAGYMELRGAGEDLYLVAQKPAR